jgi:hypothetical protein
VQSITLQHHRDSRSEQSPSATSNLDSRASELRRRGSSGCDGSAAGRLNGHGGVVCASGGGVRDAASCGWNSVAGALCGEVCTADARLVGEMEDESEVAEVGVARGVEGRVGVDVPIQCVSIPVS